MTNTQSVHRLPRFAFEAHASPYLDKAFAPQREWHQSVLASEPKPVSVLALVRAAKIALDSVREEGKREMHEALRDRRRGHWLLCTLFAIGEVTAALNAKLSLAETRALVEFLEVVVASRPPFQLHDAALRGLARLLSFQPLVSSLRDEFRAKHEESLLALVTTEGVNTWLQESALLVLRETSPALYAANFMEIFRAPLSGEAFFLRARLVRQLATDATRVCAFPSLEALWDLVVRDPSETVRMEAASVLAAEPMGESVAERLRLLLHADPSQRVRSKVIFALEKAVRAEGGAPGEQGSRVALFQTLCAESLAAKSEADAGFLRALLTALRRTAHAELLNTGRVSCVPSLATALEKTPASPLFRGMVTREWHLFHLVRWCAATPQRAAAVQKLTPFVRAIPSGKSRRLPKDLSEAFSGGEELARALSLLAADDHGFELSPGARGSWRLTRGHVFGFRLWRFLFELRTPASGKRQAFPHTVGRLFEGSIHIPSQILCELAQTTVPGEPLFLPDDEGWRPAVPLPDELVTSAFRSGPLLIVVPEGVTRVEPPRGLFARLRAYFFLSVNFEGIARSRNWVEGQQSPASEYVEKARLAGFGVSFSPFASTAAVSPVASLVRFFRSPSSGPVTVGSRATAVAHSLTDPVTVAAGAASVHATWGAFQRFVADANANTLGELVVFLFAILFLFVGSHLWRHARFRSARAGLPLVLGGWGTRGKSGTERLKAALFSSIGFGVVSKATGCEATLLVSAPFGPLKDFPLYRPYEKATIWEQQDVVEFASSFGVNVFLWECMGLTPDYVRILQGGWMRDDIATLTNTYPDHEDLQGPAGINIPQVMQNFIPKNSLLCTTEEQMLPLLRETAFERNTAFRAAGWREASLVSPEVMALFPYEEHTFNVALVLEVSDVCGIDPLYALKAMSDNVVPDIGVLKTYPAVRGHGRGLAFSNGCSANERHGCVGNWERLNFHLPPSQVPAGTFVTTFVNNRADRVARSQVFARVIALDLSADKHFLVGTNLAGLEGFLREAMDEFLRSVDLWNPVDSADGSLEAARSLALMRLRHPFNHLRLAHDHSQVEAELAVMLASFEALRGSHEETRNLLALCTRPEELQAELLRCGVEEGLVRDAVDHVRARLEQVTAWQEFAAASQKVTAVKSAAADDLNRALRDFLREQFRQKVMVLEDETQADGDTMVDALLRGIPPGFHQRLMGTQNIKGPGLALIYRLETWLALTRVLSVLENGPLLKAREAASALGEWSDVPAFARAHVRETVQSVLETRGATLGAESVAQLERAIAHTSDTGPGSGMPSLVQTGTGTMVVPGRAVTDAPRPAAAGSTYARPVYPSAPPEPSAFALPFLELIEPARAVLRRRKADRIYKAVAEGRMTLADAAFVLRELSIEV